LNDVGGDASRKIARYEE